MDINNPALAIKEADAGLFFCERDECLVFKTKVYPYLCPRFPEMFCQGLNYYWKKNYHRM